MNKLKISLSIILFVSLGITLISQETETPYVDLSKLKANEIKTSNFTVDRSAMANKEKFHEYMKAALRSRKGVIFKDDMGRIFTNGDYKFHLMPTQEADYKFSIQYKIDNNDYQYYTIPFQLEKEGNYKITYRGVDQLGNQEEAKVLNIMVDTTDPEVVVDLQGQSFTNGSIVYYKPGVKMDIKAIDKGAGVNMIMYNLGSGNLPFIEPVPFEGGDHEVVVRAMDNVFNLSKKIHINFSVDDKKPSTFIKIEPRPRELSGMLFCKKDAKIVIEGYDYESGVYSVEYSLNDDKNWTPFTGNLFVGQSEQFKIFYRSTDNSGNVSSLGEFSCKVDSKPPTTKLTIKEEAN